ncbi:MBL fold metallo-hydrolase [Candidatus Neomarinimicrobiota bacterium]
MKIYFPRIVLYFPFLVVYLLTVSSCNKNLTDSSSEPLTIILTPKHIGVNNNFNGAIDLTVGGGSPPYRYLWSNGETSEDIQNLTEGVYSVSVTDSDETTTTDSTEILRIQSLRLTLQVSNVTLNGGSDGSIDLTMTSGIPPFQFYWSNGDTTEDLSNITSGKYIVTIKDQFEQQITDSATVNEPILIVLEYTEIENDFYHLIESSVNIGLFTGVDGTLLIDSGYEHNIDRLKNTINVLSNNKITHIINTHTDNDHIGGNSLLPDSGTFICSSRGKGDVRPYNPKARIIGITEDYTLTLSDGEIVCYPMNNNGHSDSDIFIYFRNLKTIFLGDLYLSESFPAVFPSRGARVQNTISNLNFVLDNFPSDTKLIPGHGKISTMTDLENYSIMLNETVDIIISQMQLGKDLDTIINENILANYQAWGSQLEGLDADFWITAIYYSYINSI